MVFSVEDDWYNTDTYGVMNIPQIPRPHKSQPIVYKRDGYMNTTYPELTEHNLIIILLVIFIVLISMVYNKLCQISRNLEMIKNK